MEKPIKEKTPMERDYRQVLDDALKDVLQELVILYENKHYIVYIHDVTYNKDNITININWSTPHDEHEIDRDILFGEVQKAIIAQLNLSDIKDKKISLSEKIKYKIKQFCIMFNYI